ncbi:zinc-binding dehydrogenase [Rhodobium gokarnense]|uniref:Alcohol dehydrogenase n=1 Tax=Rhodobium gokarnense TaxID=364296 RepID=A0ABT3H797_9HYPH|nr:zinc-binding dehydrogenase [Rhodobium gokarnense]MCW2306265.1 alcohol dehydrogenase [Rhodobium gokarnense]
MSIEIEAAVLASPAPQRTFAEGRPLSIETLLLDPPKADEVVVRIEAASLCRSDLSVITGIRAWPMPIVPGHEASGIVEEVGSEVTGLVPGDRVVLVYQPQCGHCPDCIEGDAHLCEPGLAANRAGALLSGGQRLHRGADAVHHHMGLSAFATRAVVSEASLVKVDPDLDPDIAALFGCAVMCGAGSVIHTGHVTAGETVAIVGIGGVGASAILGARVAGAARIIAVDPDPEKRKAALDFGATDAVAAGDDAAAMIVEMTKGGVDCAFETAGQHDAFATAYGAAKRGGRVVTVGLVNPQTPFALDIAGLVTGAKSITGSYMGSCNPKIDIPKFVGLYRSGRFPVDKLITHRMPLAEVNTALDRMADSRAFRQILKP